MSADFTIEIRRGSNMLDVRVTGFFTLDDVRRFEAAVVDAGKTLGGDPAHQRVICDIAAMRIQAQEVVEAFRDMLANPIYAQRPVALIVSATLARMQAKRVVGDRIARMFATRAEAEAWLLAKDRAAA